MKLNQIFSNHMVFQANEPIRIFGEGKGTITVEFGGVCITKFFNSDKWFIELEAMTYGGPYEMTIIIDGVKSVINDMYIGEVYLLAGQSNIELPLKDTNFPKESYEDNPLVRCFMQDKLEILPDLKSADGWYVCQKDKIKNWSAIGYHMALKIANSKNIAVGLVYCYQGASVIESWLPKEISQKNIYAIPFEERGLSKSIAKNSPYNISGALYDYVQQKIAPFSFGGVVWYQGETNTGKGDYKIYGGLLKELIACWRKDFMNDDLLFVIVQIADYDLRNDEAWKKIQDIQWEVGCQLENVVAVKSADVCERFDIHPPTKTVLAERIADIFR